MMQRHKPRILIAGAGLGGLSAALGLLLRGFDVAIFEQATELREVGAGIQISPNGTRALKALGLEEDLRQSSSATARKEIRLWNTGRTWTLFDLGEDAVTRYGAPYFTIYRPDLLDALARHVNKLKPDAVQLKSRVIGFTQRDGGVDIQLEDGRTYSGDVLIGADGIHSRIRHQMFGDAAAEFTGMICWRGVIPMQDLPQYLAQPVGTNWVGPGGHVIHYPLRRSTLMNFAAVIERQDWKSEGWTTRGDPEDFRRDFRGWHPDVQTMINAVAEPYKWALISREPLKCWTQGRVTLMGDACHATLPFLAQGAVQAIEDGYILARALEQYDEVETALTRYEAARVARTCRMVAGSAENSKRFHNPRLSETASAEKYIDEEWATARVGDRYDWLFKYNVESVPI